MIKINLLGDEPEAPVNSILALAAYGSSLVLVILLWVIINFYTLNSISNINEQLQVSQIQLNTIKEKTKEVDGLKKTKDELENITLAIAVLRRMQQGPVKLLDDINLATPEKVWITEIDSKIDKMRITALSLTDTDISTFIQNLRKSSLIPEAELIERTSSPLMQVNSFNSFSGDQTKRVIKGDRGQLSAVLAEIRKEAEDIGLNFSNGVPESSLKDSVATIGNPAEGAVTKLSFNDIKSKAKSGRPTIYAWESLEQVKGISFVADLKVRYDDSGVNLDEISNLLLKEEVDTEKPVNKKVEKKVN